MLHLKASRRCVYVRGGEREGEREEVRVRSRWGIYLWDEG